MSVVICLNRQSVAPQPAGQSKDRDLPRSPRPDPPGSIGEDEDEVDDNDILGDGAEGVSRTAGGAASDDDSELPPELRMDDYDNEPGLTVTAPRGGGGGGGGEGEASGSDDGEGDGADDEPDAMDEDEEEEEEDEGLDDGDEGDGEAMGVSLLEEPSTGQVFAYESEGEDSDTEDNIIKPGDHVLLTASTEEVCTLSGSARERS